MAQVSDLSAIRDLAKNFGDFNNMTFWRQVLLYTQQSQGNTLSECITTFDSFQTLLNTVRENTKSSTEYFKGIKDKGQG